MKRVDPVYKPKMLIWFNALQGIGCCLLFAGIALDTSSLVRAQDQQSRHLPVENAMLKSMDTTTVASQIAGIVNSVTVKEGHVVKVGQELGRIRDTAVKLQIERAKAAVNVAKSKEKNDIDERLAQKNQAVAENEYQRAVKANQMVRDTYPLNEIDRLKLVSDRAKLETERAVFLRTMASLDSTIAETELRQALELLDRHRVLSPTIGIVVSIEKHAGEWVEPGSELMKIERIDQLRIEGFVKADDASMDLLERTAQVRLTQRTGTIESTGKVSFVSPSVSPIDGTVRIYVDIDNKEGKFRPGLHVDTTILLEP